METKGQGGIGGRKGSRNVKGATLGVLSGKPVSPSVLPSDFAPSTGKVTRKET